MSVESETKVLRAGLPIGLAGAAAALVGILRVPYGYYEFMRVVVVACCVGLGVLAASKRQWQLVVPLGITACVFVFVRGIPRPAWQVIDLIAAVVMIGVGAFLSSLAGRKP